MFSQIGVHIFKDPNECLECPAAKNYKPAKNVSKHRSLSIKDSTNIFKSSKSISESGLKDLKQSSDSDISSKKKSTVFPELQLLSEVKKCINSESEDELSEIENMDIYEEQEDDYEDIMPKCERIQNKDIDYLFEFSPVCKLPEVTVDRPPVADLNEDCDLNYSVPSPVFYDFCREAFSCDCVEPPSSDFNF